MSVYMVTKLIRSVKAVTTKGATAMQMFKITTYTDHKDPVTTTDLKIENAHDVERVAHYALGSPERYTVVTCLAGTVIVDHVEDTITVYHIDMAYE